ncbi:hypothetical protein QRQ56_30765 [Bradyrhizobium sp. U531]|uniref:hypothetical protein n=1 Tax=Bradyrhizobium sp. U531 TaxID=3053458 RepID=UPI003F42FFA5
MSNLGKKRSSLWLLASAALLIGVIVLGYFMIGGEDSGAVHADSGITTEQAAAHAGAKVLPTDPGLKIEPK